MSLSVNLNHNRSTTNHSVATVKSYQGSYSQHKNRADYNPYPQQAQFKRQYYSTISDQRDLARRQEDNMTKKAQLNSFLSGITSYNVIRKNKPGGKNSKKLKQSAYNILNNNNSRIKKQRV